MKRWPFLGALTSTGLVVFPAYLASGDPPADECKFPHDCHRHTIVGLLVGEGRCVSKTAWRERFIRATPAERSNMYAERRKPISRRVFDAYNLTDAQEAACEPIKKKFFEDRKQEMGKPLVEEAVSLRRAMRERFKERRRARDAVGRGEPVAEEALEALGSRRDDPLTHMYRDRMNEINHAHPVDWFDLAKRIEVVLPPEQAKEGRLRLAERFPNGFDEFPRARANDSEADASPDGGSENNSYDGAPDRWEAYVVRFKASYPLTPGQETAVASILRETQGRASRLARTMRDAVAQDEAAGNDESARDRRGVFDYFIDEMFEEFKTRLIALLTTSQKEAAKEP